MDHLKTTIDSIRNLIKWVYFNDQFLPAVIEHKRRNGSQFSNLLQQLCGTERVLCHLSSSTLEAHWPVLQELDYVLGRAINLVMEVCFKSKDSISRREHDTGEHYLEVFLDLRWWTWVLIYNAPLRIASHGERFLVTPKGVLKPSSSRLPSFMQKLYLWWSRCDGYSRHLPSYGIEVFVKETEGLSSLVAWLKTESGMPLDKFYTTRDICSASAEEIFIIRGKVLVQVLHARKPSWVGNELMVDLTQVFLGMSSSGLVIKCKDSGTEYALKRVQNLDQRQPVIARLCHPHIVQLMSFWRENKNGFLFLMMELMEGDLKDLIRRRLRVKKSPFIMNVVLDILLQIAKAMLYLHDMDLTHPHLKSSDVLFKEAADRSKLDKNDTKYLVKLGDFQTYSQKDFESMAQQNVYQFGLICLEVLSTEPLCWELEDRVMGVSEEPKEQFTKIQNRPGCAIPGSLTQCITRCLDGSIKFSEVVVMLLLAQLQVLLRATKEPSPRSIDSEHTLLAEHQGCQFAMEDPLFTLALVRAIVSLLLKEVIDASKGALRIKESCKALKVKVDKIVPLLEVVEKTSIILEQVHLNLLSEFNTILINAQSVLEEILEELRASKWVRLMKVWQWHKLPSCLRFINDQIDEARLNAILATLGANIQSSNSTSKQSKSKVDIVIQSTPPLIVGVEKSFSKLKTSILASHTKAEPTFLGLQGRGGVGKTLLAEQLNNDEDIKNIYESQGILWITVGSDARILDLYKTMGKLLNDGAFEEECVHCNQEDQRTYLWNAFAKKKVFLVLDDVWENKFDHREMMYWLNIASSPGSTTLITTRSTTVLSKVHAQVEEVSLLSCEDSWTLFCAHAFKSGTRLPNILEDLAREVCKECKGLPLALKVIGSAMLDKHEMEEWHSTLFELKQSLNSNVDDELYHHLQISYNNLKDNVTKMCFLYCAAFPKDYKIQIRDLYKIWITEGLFGILDIKNLEDVAMAHLETLVKQSMIDWNRKFGYITIHYILRDLAIYIIDTAKPGDFAYKCWFQTGKVLTSPFANKSLKKMQRLSFVQSNVLKWPDQLHASHLQVCLLRAMSVGEKGLNIPERFFSNLRTLKYLDLSRNHFDEKLPEMRGLESLLVLDLQGCRSLIELPQSIGELTSLIELNLSGCESLKVLPHSIGCLNRLTKLDLHSCRSLNELPQQINELTSLIELNLFGCKSLKVLPYNIGRLNRLPKLDLQECQFLTELPQQINELTSLIELNLSGCKSLKVLPYNIGRLNRLTKLDLHLCESLSQLPESIGRFNSLIELNLSGCESLKVLPHSIVRLNHLTKLDLQWCGSLIELPESIGELSSLIELNLSECKSLKVLPHSIGRLNHLTKLDLQWCGSLIELPESIGELSSLIDLNLSRCKSLKVLPYNIGRLNRLTKLDLQWCRSLIELPESIGELNSLIELNLSECQSLKVLPYSIERLNQLTKLDLQWCESLIELPHSIDELNSLNEWNLSWWESLKVHPHSIGCLNHLTKLDLQQYRSLIELPESIGELNSLIELNLSGYKCLKVLPHSIGRLNHLTKLDLHLCGSLIELPKSIGKLNSLIELNLSECKSLKVLPQSIGRLNHLTKLDLQHCRSLIELPESIGELNSLIELNLSRCKSLKVLPYSIQRLNRLTKLDLHLCGSLIELPKSIGKLNSLIELNLSECKSLKVLPQSIGKLNSLIELNLSECKSLKVLPQSIGRLNHLTKLDLQWCGSLIELPHSIGELNSLIELNLTGCESLKVLPHSIRHLIRLTKLDLQWCGSLIELPESIGELNSLIELNLSWCKSLKVLPYSIRRLNRLIKLDLHWCGSLIQLPESIWRVELSH